MKAQSQKGSEEKLYLGSQKSMQSMKYEQINLNQIFQEDIDSKVNTLDNSQTQRSNKDNQITFNDTERNNSIENFQPNDFNFKKRAIDFIKQNRYNSKVKHIYDQYDKNPKGFFSTKNQIKVEEYDHLQNGIGLKMEKPPRLIYGETNLTGASNDQDKNEKREITASGKLRPWSPQDTLNYISNYKKNDNPPDVSSTINSVVQTFQSDRQNKQILSRRISMHQKSQAHEKDWVNFSKHY